MLCTQRVMMHCPFCFGTSAHKISSNKSKKLFLSIQITDLWKVFFFSFPRLLFLLYAQHYMSFLVVFIWLFFLLYSQHYRSCVVAFVWLVCLSFSQHYMSFLVAFIWLFFLYILNTIIMSFLMANIWLFFLSFSQHYRSCVVVFVWLYVFSSGIYLTVLSVILSTL